MLGRRNMAGSFLLGTGGGSNGSTEGMFRCIWLQQAYETKKRLGENFAELAGDDAVEIRIIKTTGDMILDKVSLQHLIPPLL
jgi:hypothetical protein